MHPDLSTHAYVCNFFSSECTHHSCSKVLRHLISVGKYEMIGSWMCETSVAGLPVGSWVGTGKER